MNGISASLVPPFDPLAKQCTGELLAVVKEPLVADSPSSITADWLRFDRASLSFKAKKSIDCGPPNAKHLGNSLIGRDQLAFVGMNDLFTKSQGQAVHEDL